MVNYDTEVFHRYLSYRGISGDIPEETKRDPLLPIHDALDDTINVYVWLWCVELRVENPISWQRIVGASVFMNATANKPDTAGKKGATMTTTRKGAAWWR